MMVESAAGWRGALRVIGRALAHRDYRLFFGGQCVSQVGTWMQQMTVIWLAYRLTEDPFLVGLVGFCAQAPTFALAPVAGVWSDRLDRRRLLMATQALAMVQAFTLAILAFSGWLELWSLAVLVAALGAINAFDMTASQAFVKDLVRERADLGSAIALNSAINNSARLIGPAIATAMIHFFGEGGCFLLNSVSFLAVLIALALMSPTIARAHRAAQASGFGEAVRYVAHNGPIRDLLILVAALALFGMPYSLLPVFAAQHFQSATNALGVLMGAGGLGALIATLHVASRRSIIGAESGLVQSGLVLSAALALTGATEMLWFAVLCRMVASACVVHQMTTVNTLIQTLVADDRRGRVMSLYTMAALGALPLGNLLAGALAGTIGVVETFALNGICCLAGATWFWLRLPGFRRESEPVYERLRLAGLAPAPPADAPLAGEAH